MEILLVFLILSIAIFFLWKKSIADKKLHDSLSSIPLKFETDLSDLTTQYIANSDIKKIRKEYQTSFNNISALPSPFLKKFTDLKRFIASYSSLEKWAEQKNELFIEAEEREMKVFFQNIDGKALDQQQQKAVIVNEDNTLVLAGAGSGKTLTISAKVKYLVERLGVHPDDILLISFTAKSATEMTERIATKLNIPVKAKTFHQLGLQIITDAQKGRPEIENDLPKAINDYFKQTILKNPQLMGNVIHFYSSYLSIPKDLEGFNNLGEFHDDQSTMNLETLRSKLAQQESELHQQRITLKLERVKSLEEVMIANFLFLNGIDYQYEKLYPFEGDKYRKRYRPDFYLPQFDIYLEHFGITENERAPWLSEIEERKYIEDMKWKHSWHLANGTKLLETYSYFNKNGLLLEKLRTLLLQQNIPLRPVDLSEVYRKLLINRKEERQFKELKSLIATFITLFKSNGFEEDDFLKMRQKFSGITNPFLLERTKLFLSIVSPIYRAYQQQLMTHHSIDFSDMINQASTIVETSDTVIGNYKYIIIDEYQDISMGRYRLINAIKEKTQAKLLCVGDDWQSIFRFAGSDLNLFIEFEKYFGFTKLLKIEKTYRNSQTLIDFAGNFVMKNEKQLKKQLVSDQQKENPIQIFGYDVDAVKAFVKAIENIVFRYGRTTEIMVIGRNNMDLAYLIEKDEHQQFIYREDQDNKFLSYLKYPGVRFRFTTVHRSKGLEAENVILINLVNHLIGFPNKISDDPLLSLVLTDSDEFTYAEERRLFYVALTRTKNLVYLIAPQKETSIFVEELIKDHNILFNIVTGEKSLRENPQCPVCKKGHMTLRENKADGRRFLGCSNYPLCSTTFKEVSILTDPVLCSTCGGFMVKRNGSKGQFYGCRNYPLCRNSLNINESPVLV